GRGGPLTITDCNLLLGRLAVERFPFPLHPAAAAARLEEIARQVGPTPQPPSAADPQPASRLPPPPADPASDATARDAAHARTPPAPSGAELLALAAGFVRIANLQMAQAIRAISIRQGYDMRDYTLVAFGSAGPQHACAVADELGMRHVLIPAQAGVLSALGIGLAEVRRQRMAGVYAVWDAAGQALAAQVLAQLAAQVRSDLTAEGVADDAMRLEECLELRYVGTEAALSIPRPDDGDYASAFAREHQKRYGYVQPDRPLEVVLARVEGSSQTAVDLPRLARTKARKAATPHASQPLWTAEGWRQAGVFERDRLEVGMTVAGPALVVEDLTTTVLEPGCQAEVLAGGGLWLSRHPQEPAAASLPASLATSIAAHGGAGSAGLVACGPADPVLLEVFHRHFTAIATQMGLALRNTAISVNVKERLDFSCALFTARGELVVNAPHIPVHLGAMGETVRQVLRDHPGLSPGDVVVTNDPYHGGSHLPDVTVVTPVHDPASGRLLFFTASRAHHAELGGIVPGSMPPFSRSLAEEGVLICNFKLVEAGRSRFDELRALLEGPPYPSRAVADNLADIRAQLAANRQGARDLQRLIGRYGLAAVEAYMGYIQQAAETKVRQALRRLASGTREFVDYLDDGSAICLRLTLHADRAVFDFTGSANVHPGNLNANRAIVTAAILYCLRCLLQEDIPLNEGVLTPVELILPEGLLNPPPGPTPETSPAVVGGNVETSQRIVDVILGALGLAAASQGTMNNLLFGDGSFGYYETICGGAGATPHRAGADAVHTHMTNTRLTDVEVLEMRYPVRVREFCIRRGSGGSGRHRGGDGVVRQLEFLKPLTISLLSQRRGPYPPYGLAGGQPGALGRNTLLRASGETLNLPGCAQLEVQPGDVLVIETPGGGGYG
ncbi:MAG: hydantoinase B/oxoprolinase family protein, partial [Pirellulales bacterium]|nr:hydantoinase B/oxoprolinase family protein [Pirellulales bacterium]